MMEEYGTVVELKDAGVATILCCRSSMCEHCAAAEACHSGNDKQTMLVDAINPLGATVGQRVRLAVDTSSFLRSSFILYIVPLIALVIGAASGEMLGRLLHLNADPNLLAALFGTVFLVGSLLFIKFAGKILSNERYMPRITAIIEEEN
ncbi:MAG: SoxR reducing system RseC family protein [Desulfuromonadales bacterium]|nr:SoxR reducing system RseC family protein [Desulfuromonadales bacterium]